jgi:hypothetical protein
LPVVVVVAHKEDKGIMALAVLEVEELERTKDRVTTPQVQQILAAAEVDRTVRAKQEVQA